jgi:RHS repeat-associated protein
VILDASGNVSGRQAHLPYGEDFAQSGTQDKHHLANYERDSETGTDYGVNRQYSQSIGRFNRVDPVAARLSNPQEFNRFAYVKNDPINLFDPKGLEACYVMVEGQVVEVPCEPDPGGSPDDTPIVLQGWSDYEPKTLAEIIGGEMLRETPVTLDPGGGVPVPTWIPPSQTDQALALYADCLKTAQTTLKKSVQSYFGARFSLGQAIKRLLFKNFDKLLPGAAAGGIMAFLLAGGPVAMVVAAISGALLATGVAMLVEDTIEIGKWLDQLDVDKKNCHDQLVAAFEKIFGPPVGPPNNP